MGMGVISRVATGAKVLQGDMSQENLDRTGRPAPPLPSLRPNA